MIQTFMNTYLSLCEYKWKYNEMQDRRDNNIRKRKSLCYETNNETFLVSEY